MAIFEEIQIMATKLCWQLSIWCYSKAWQDTGHLTTDWMDWSESVGSSMLSVYCQIWQLNAIAGNTLSLKFFNILSNQITSNLSVTIQYIVSLLLLYCQTLTVYCQFQSIMTHCQFSMFFLNKLWSVNQAVFINVVSCHDIQKQLYCTQDIGWMD